MFSYLDKVNSILRNDSDLWKLLYYKSDNYNDNPLDKPDILALPPAEQYPIINKRLKHTPSTSDLVEEQLCRIIFYPARRSPSSSFNYATATQEITFDVFVHADYNDTDMRLSKICDHLNDLIFDKKISNLGTAKLRSAQPFILEEQGYIGYTMTYELGSVS